MVRTARCIKVAVDDGDRGDGAYCPPSLLPHPTLNVPDSDPGPWLHLPHWSIHRSLGALQKGFNQYLLSTCSVPRTVLGAGTTDD